MDNHMPSEHTIANNGQEDQYEHSDYAFVVKINT